jgi:hypothetical protein
LRKDTAMTKLDDIDWTLTTFEGSRREQLRRALKLTVRERLQALEDMAAVAKRFADMRANKGFSRPIGQANPTGTDNA